MLPMGQHRPGKVLVVDENSVRADLVAQVLSLAGLEAVTAYSGVAALSILTTRRSEIGWLFTSLELPGLICGVVLADEFQRWRPGRPLVFSGTPQIERQGAIFVPPPASPMLVLEVFRSLYAKAQEARATGQSEHSALEAA